MAHFRISCSDTGRILFLSSLSTRLIKYHKRKTAFMSKKLKAVKLLSPTLRSRKVAAEMLSTAVWDLISWGGSEHYQDSNDDASLRYG